MGAPMHFDQFEEDFQSLLRLEREVAGGLGRVLPQDY
jgi:hypothetical protein